MNNFVCQAAVFLDAWSLLAFGGVLGFIAAATLAGASRQVTLSLLQRSLDVLEHHRTGDPEMPEDELIEDLKARLA